MNPKSRTITVLAAAVLATAACAQGERGETPGKVRSVSAEVSAHPAFDSLMTRARAERWHDMPIGRIVQNVGLHFVGSPYVAGLLDRAPVETLVTSFDGFDCVLLVETAVAAARGIRDQDYSFDGFLERIKSLRYRSGILDGYCSRLHYFSEWIRDNERRGTVRDLTESLGGKLLEKKLDFMTSHRESYPRMAASDSLFAGIANMEASLVGMPLYYVPQDEISSVYELLQPGDIIATATSVGGLDVSHSGLVYQDGEGVGFLHASTAGGVMVSPDLQRYVQNIDIQIGIVVARPL